MYTRDVYQIGGLRPSWVPQSLVDTPVLQDLLIYLMIFLKGGPLSVPGVPQNFSGVPPSVLIYAYGISISGVQPSLWYPLCVDGVPNRITIPPFVLGTMIYSDD